MSEQDIEIPESDDAPDDEEPTTGHRFTGTSTHTYPHRRDPRTGNVLVAEPGVLLDFGEEMPPDDGRWYNISSGETYTSSPASTGAGETEE